VPVLGTQETSPIRSTATKAFLQPTIFNDNVNQFKVGLESDKGYFTLKVKTMTLMSHFFCPQYSIVHSVHTQELNWVQNNSIFLELVAKQVNIFGYNRELKNNK
jgi:hypothetical protein